MSSGGWNGHCASMALFNTAAVYILLIIRPAVVAHASRWRVHIEQLIAMSH
jgi:hypothetical protein